jgi:hypothetical protein
MEPIPRLSMARAGAGRADAGYGRAADGERSAADQDGIHGLGPGAIAAVATALFLLTGLHPLLLGAAAPLGATGSLT